MKPMLSLMLAALLAMSGCSASREAAASRLAIGAGGGPAPAVLTRTLAEPVYPEFPKQPDMPETGGQEAWEAYDEAYGKYMDALMAIRGTDAPNLTQEEREALTAFAARSTTLVLAGYARYLKGVDDTGAAFEPSPDPLLAELQAIVAPLEVKEGAQDMSCLKALYSRKDVFGLDLYEAGLGGQIEGMAAELFAGPGAVRNTLHKYVSAR